MTSISQQRRWYSESRCRATRAARVPSLGTTADLLANISGPLRSLLFSL